MQAITEIEIYDVLRNLGLKYRDKGNEIYLHCCPFCEEGRDYESDHFSFQRETGMWKCFKCEEKGNLITFKRAMGIDVFKESKSFRRLDQKEVKSFAKQEKTYYEKYEESRGIPAEIVEKFGVGLKRNVKGLGTCRTYPYFDTDGEVVNIKYINNRKQMKTEYNARQTYFGLNLVDFNLDYIIVTEGEDDAMAMCSMGYTNVVSVPYGAGHYSEDMGTVNAKFKTVWLFFDNDVKGQEGARKFAQKAGTWKCNNVVLPFKDARECYLNGFRKDDLDKIAEKFEQFDYDPSSVVRPAISMAVIMDKYQEEVIKDGDGIRLGYDAIDGITGGLRGGDQMVFLANPGCFKTTMLQNTLIRVTDSIPGGIGIYFSLEMTDTAAWERDAQIRTGNKTYDMRDWAKNNTGNWRGLREFYERSNLYVYDKPFVKIPDIRKIVRATEEAVGKPVKIVGIDYLDFLDSEKQTEYDGVRHIMNNNKQLLKEIGIPGVMLVQTNRSSDRANSEVHMRSGKGGTGIESACDFLIGMWRNGERVIGRFNKHRRVDSRYNGKPNPYLAFDIDFPNYRINDISYCEKPTKKDNSDDFSF